MVNGHIKRLRLSLKIRMYTRFPMTTIVLHYIYCIVLNSNKKQTYRNKIILKNIEYAQRHRLPNFPRYLKAFSIVLQSIFIYSNTFRGAMTTFTIVLLLLLSYIPNLVFWFLNCQNPNIFEEKTSRSYLKFS